MTDDKPNFDPDAYRESDAEYDGAFSYAAEYHAFSLGVFDGMRTWRLRPKDYPDNTDVEKEPHYYAGGYVIGTLLQLVIALAVGNAAGLPLPF